MRVPARVDYAVRAAVELARRDEPTKCRDIAHAQHIPLKFLVNILSDLRRARIVRSQRGAEGGYWLVRPADRLTVTDVMEAVMGPLSLVDGAPTERVRQPDQVHQADQADQADQIHQADLASADEPTMRVWSALELHIRAMLDSVTIADLVAGGPVVRR